MSNKEILTVFVYAKRLAVVCASAMDWPYTMLVRPSTAGVEDVPQELPVNTANAESMSRRWLELRWSEYCVLETGDTTRLRAMVDACGLYIQRGWLAVDGFYYGLVSEYAVQECMRVWFEKGMSAPVYSAERTHTRAIELLVPAVRHIHESTLHMDRVHGMLVRQLHEALHLMTNLVIYYDRSLQMNVRPCDVRDDIQAVGVYRDRLRRKLWTSSRTLGYYGTTVPRPAWLDVFLCTMDGYLIHVMYKTDVCDPRELSVCTCVH